ncbi:host-nuclease inhibitor Gam family protein [Methylomonas sp. MED-D]|uniref:host-nuclease inhibitor Gam family protein n=1 Tax=unclassified Methylomonas TaxID=2608980 RepID=UPI003D05C0D1
MKKPTKLKAVANPTADVPRDRDACAESINEIGRLTRQITVLQAAMNDEIAAITDDYTGKITAINDSLKRLQDGVQLYCEANREELTDGGKTKTIGFVTGTVQFRLRPPSVSIRGAEAVIDALKARGLIRFVRVKEEVNKDAILNETAVVAGVPGITIKTGVEDCTITPFEQELS